MIACIYRSQHALPHDLCTVHPLEKSILVAALQQRLYCALPFLTTFLVSRAVSAEEWARTPQAQTEGSKLFKAMSSTSAELLVTTIIINRSIIYILCYCGSGKAGW